MKKMKYNCKFVLVMVLVMVVIAALVTSMMSSALFGLQHNWYDISKSGNDVPCYKCHKNIEAEFNDMPSAAPHKSKACVYCHRNESGVTYAVGDGLGSQPGKEAHAASIPPCQQCHIPDTTNLSSVNESHKPLNDTSGLNEACILCHTGFDKSLDFKRALYVEYDLVDTAGGYNIQNFSFVSSNSTIINLTPPGSKHTWGNASEINCFDCHSDVKNALANGGHVPSSGNTSGELSHGGKTRKAERGHKGRRHDFSRTAVTIESCKPCHLPSASDFGTWCGSGCYNTHPEAQLDYHAATTEHCYNCHYNGTINAPGGGGSCGCRKCHDVLRTGNHVDILDSMFDQNFCWYQVDKVCIGCHMPGPDDNVPFYDRHFEVYTEPNTAILVTPTPPP